VTRTEHCIGQLRCKPAGTMWRAAVVVARAAVERRAACSLSLRRSTPKPCVWRGGCIAAMRKHGVCDPVAPGRGGSRARQCAVSRSSIVTARGLLLCRARSMPGKRRSRSAHAKARAGVCEPVACMFTHYASRVNFGRRDGAPRLASTLSSTNTSARTHAYQPWLLATRSSRCG
jgi:hypothetical protein